jgi:hypothetical protein
MDDDLYEELVELFFPDNKTVNEIIELFEKVLDALFSDNIFNFGRLTAIERFASRIIERSLHLDTISLSSSLKESIKSARSKKR